MDREIEVMRVIRVPPRGQLVVQVGEKRYEELEEITRPELKQRLLAAIGELIVFAKGYQTLVDAGVAPSVAVLPQKEPSLDTPPPEEDADLEKRRAAFIESLEKQRDTLKAEASKGPPSLGIPFLSRRDPEPAAPSPMPVDEPAAPPEPKRGSIVEQINAILEKYIAADSSLAGRAIHLEQSRAGGLHIIVDGVRYQRPAEVKEKEIQLLIKMAIKEWEGR